MRHPKNTCIFLIIFLLIFFGCARKPSLPKPNAVAPNAIQICYQQMELIGFIHFSINTFTGKEWGYGDESPTLFNPSNLDVEQWVLTAKNAGFGQLILTAKHHDGFCLWPSKLTDHSVKNSVWKNGKGDLVNEFVSACRKHGLKAGLYLSPWDRNHAGYGTSAYIDYFRKQLTELLTQYGEINEIWFDGANGGDGYYGGACETRYIDRKTYYDWPQTMALVKRLQPNTLIFSDAGPDIRWVGNEDGHAGEIFWSTISDSGLVIGAADQHYLNTGDPGGNVWMIGQCDVSIRPGWFFHESENLLVKTPQQLVDLYYMSVGRNGVLLLNIPPDSRGRLNPIDSSNLISFKNIIDETFSNNLARDAVVNTTNTRQNHRCFCPANMIDGNNQTYWTTDDGIIQAEIDVELKGPTTFNRVMIKETIAFGQRVGRFEVWAKTKQNWVLLASATTIGYKRLLRVPEITALQVRIKILEANNPPVLSEFGLYHASPGESFN